MFNSEVLSTELMTLSDEKRVTAMMIGMTGNLEGEMEFLSIDTGKRVSCVVGVSLLFSETIYN
jgi:hypothetical protein